MSDKSSKKQFLSAVSELRARARQKIEEGAVTDAYTLNPEEACSVLNEALATELVCVLRYRFHYFMASGIHSGAVSKEFLIHSNEELGHADLLAERIKQLGGKPEMNPDVLSKLSHSEYKEGGTLSEMLKEDLIAERIAIESYRELITYFGDQDPTTRRMLEEILAVEEEHADELADFLFAQQEGSDTSRRLYAKDEVAANQAAPKGAKKAAAGSKVSA